MGKGASDDDPDQGAVRDTLGRLAAPLDYILGDHLSERRVCEHLDRLAAGGALGRAEIAEALRFLQDDLPHHLQDEELDLFPVLRKRCEPEDEIDKAIARLTSDHAHAAEDTPAVIAVLGVQLRAKRPLSRGEGQCLSAYAAQARRHMTLENAIVLPLAKLRLTKRDQARMAVRMAQRRGLGPKPENTDAG